MTTTDIFLLKKLLINFYSVFLKNQALQKAKKFSKGHENQEPMETGLFLLLWHL